MQVGLSTLVVALLTLMVAFDGRAASPNLVANGSFDLGNTNFTSGYAYSPASNTAEGQYTVRSNPYPWNSLFISAKDHTSGGGLMYVANGSPTGGTTVWQSDPISVSQNTDYFFEAFVMNVCCSSPFPGNTPSVLDFYVSGLSLGTATTNLSLAGSWEGVSKSWNSGSFTLVTLKLINRNTALLGNDFAIDDIYFGTQSTLVPEPESRFLIGLGLAAMMISGLLKRMNRSTGPLAQQ